ncbi:IclR family transcriptional regulator [uncultured Modestobacter sp.]|uniref:IclR family transcriptional regulator n=1 Tax=uncultured Modestobacter sp. TaxID=380048 RepID=UPI00262FE53D|nr:IclR family transcriptional regulator [uncultured Modestobacter sp.]
MRSGAEGGGLVQSVDRALEILAILAREGATGVTDVAGQLGVHKSTASRLLSTLEARGMVEQERERGTYRLGFGLVRLAGAGAAQLDLTRVAREACERLSAELGETVNLAVLDGDAAVNVSQVHGAASVGVLDWVGRRTPLHATSSGKALLAHAPAEVVAAVLARPLARYTDATVTDATALRAVLARIREQGWAATEGELEVGLHAVSAPVCAVDGRLVAAISVSAPSYRLPSERIAEVAVRVCSAAEAIRSRLG